MDLKNKKPNNIPEKKDIVPNENKVEVKPRHETQPSQQPTIDSTKKVEKPIEVKPVTVTINTTPNPKVINTPKQGEKSFKQGDNTPKQTIVSNKNIEKPTPQEKKVQSTQVEKQENKKENSATVTEHIETRVQQLTRHKIRCT